MRIKPLCIILVWVTLLPTGIWAQTKINKAQVSFTFVSKKVDGTISGFDSSSTLDLAQPKNSEFKGSVSVETLKTGNFLRDWSLKGGKYFDADTHPRITFESTSVVPTAHGFEVTGFLTLKGQRKQITWDFSKKGNQLIGTTTLFTSDFGIDIKKDRADNEVNVRLVLDLG